MLYQKEIDDSVLIQFIILYTLNNADSAVKYDKLIDLVLNNCNINFNDFQIALANLVETGHVNITLSEDDMQLYEITPKGSAAGEFFKFHIPVYIREPIDGSIKELFLEERKKNAVRSTVTPINTHEYNADCALYDDDRTMLLSISLYSGSREEAEKNAVYFKEHADIVYEKIIKAFSDKNE